MQYAETRICLSRHEWVRDVTRLFAFAPSGRFGYFALPVMRRVAPTIPPSRCSSC
jgi:hypothetical protein